MNDRTLGPGDTVELNSGGPPMTIVEVTSPGRAGANTTDIVAWWRAVDNKPQIIEIDGRCVRLVARGGGLPR